MSDSGTNYRKERIERLLKELNYEIHRGMIDGEIDETFVYEFFVPISKEIPNGIVFCSFRTRPLPHYVSYQLGEPRLKIVKSDYATEAAGPFRPSGWREVGGE